VYQPKSVKEGNVSAISVLVTVDKQLEHGQELEEGSFRFLVDQIRDDMLGELPGELLNYREWLRRFHLNCTALPLTALHLQATECNALGSSYCVAQGGPGPLSTSGAVGGGSTGPFRINDFYELSIIFIISGLLTLNQCFCPT
jgi:hypothetical protein